MFKSVGRVHHDRRLLSFGMATCLTLSSAFAASLIVGTAGAQENASQSAASGEVLDEVMVTGTRIRRDGYDAPTPVSVLGTDELDAMAVTNIADAVNRLPTLLGTVTTTNSSTSDMTLGIQNLNLRGLSPTRTLVLLDGKRIVGSTLAGFDNNGSAVDVNSFPNGLIERVEVVTGGASAAYGSDALAGVVNFILDKDYTGIKGTVQGGITSYGDDENYKLTLTTGTPFAQGRGHFLLAGEHTYTHGIRHKPRDWADVSYSLMNNPRFEPGNGEPQYITAFNTGLALATPGGLIVSGPLRGTMFLQNGAPATFNFGETSGILMTGGDWRLSRIDDQPMLDLQTIRANVFTRASYELTNNVSVFGEVLWANTRSRTFDGVPMFHLGNITIHDDNPFIPASVKARMTELGLESFTMGSTGADYPQYSVDNRRVVRRYLAGFEGNFDVKGTNWMWDTYYERSTTDAFIRLPDNEIPAHYNLAVDAVIDPETGQIVCRSSLTDPGNGCVPYNPMGIGVNSRAAIDYIGGTGSAVIELQQDVFAASATGEPLSSWAGPVSAALGVEHRREKVGGTSSELDAAGAFFVGNFTSTHGKYDVTEGFLETVVPLARDESWADSLDLNAAVRATDYSTSGYVTTWKVGTTYSPAPDLTIRATQSRDIRAPTLGDLFSAGRSGTGSVVDPKTGEPTTIVSRVQGNRNLNPEKADSTGFGIVLQPSFLPGFGASVDYFDVEIKDAITSLNAQQYVDRCSDGETEFCSFIERDANDIITFVAVQPANVLSQRLKGYDFEVSYNFPLSNIVRSWDGAMTLRGMATYISSLKTIDQDVVIEGAGVNASGGGGISAASGLYAPEFRYLASATIDYAPFSAMLTFRGVGSGVYNNAAIECTSGCPAPTPTAPTINNNRVDAVNYVDFAINYRLKNDSLELYFVADNVFDTDPPLIAGTRGNAFYAGQANGDFYDVLGRMFRAGFRFEL